MKDSILKCSVVAGMLLASIGTGLAQCDITITTQPPQCQTNCIGTTANFAVEATGTEPLSYQWQLSTDGGASYWDRPERTNSTLVITNVQSSDSGSYRVIITNVTGTVTSEVALLVVAATPIIIIQPTIWPSVSLGVTVSNRVYATGNLLSYQWRLNGEPLAGQTRSSIVLTNLQVADAGSYDVVVANICGLTNSCVVTLVVDPTFIKITTGRIVTDTPGSGLFSSPGWADYDCDGWEDLLIASRPTLCVLYRNKGDGTFDRITSGLITQLTGSGRGVAWGDYDNDGFPDLFIGKTMGESDTLLRNKGDGTFSIQAANVVGRDSGWANGCGWADYDQDGFLDLFVANADQRPFLYHNNGAGDFTRITNGTLPEFFRQAAYGSPWGDYNNDGLIDLLLGSLPSVLWQNQGDGTFIAITNTPITTDRYDPTGAAWGDYDNDGDLDLYLACFGPNAFYRNNGDGTFTRLTNNVSVLDPRPSGINSFTAVWGDYDNDGYLDLFVVNENENSPGHGPPQPKNYLFHNNGAGDFTKITEGSFVNEEAFSTGAAWVDYNNDGFLDLFVSNLIKANELYLNNGNTNHWLRFKLVGTVSNRSAIGAKVRVHTTIRGHTFWQLREVANGDGFSGSSLITHFGLGDATNADLVRIEWPSGVLQILTNVAAGQRLTVEEHQDYIGPSPAFAGATTVTNGLQVSIIEPAAGAVYALEASTDLVKWIKLMARTSAGGTFAYTDTRTASYPRRFYRIVVP